eukprot:15469646-Alexandrium_andersonii.AAC.1
MAAARQVVGRGPVGARPIASLFRPGLRPCEGRGAAAPDWPVAGVQGRACSQGGSGGPHRRGATAPAVRSRDSRL